MKKIWVDPALLNKEYPAISLLNPWYEESSNRANKAVFCDPKSYPYNDIWKEWNTQAPLHYELSADPNLCNVGVIPIALNQIPSEDLQQLLQKDHPKRLIGFWLGDEDLDNGFEGIEVYAQSTNRSKHSPNIKTLPAWASDILQKYNNNKLPAPINTKQPTVSFCGNGFGAQSTFARKLIKNSKHFIKKILGRKTNQAHPRALALESCIWHPKVKAHFDIKQDAWRGFTFANNPQVEQLRSDQERFADNLFSADYAICVRGAGNFSYRFYEVLSSGRIPVIIDTDTLPPLDNQIDWKEMGVWVSHPKQTAEAIWDHFKKTKDLARAQEKVQKLWSQKIRPEAWFRDLIEKPN